jgi:hypothetical protein
LVALYFFLAASSLYIFSSRAMLIEETLIRWLANFWASELSWFLLVATSDWRSSFSFSHLARFSRSLPS